MSELTRKKIVSKRISLLAKEIYAFKEKSPEETAKLIKDKISELKEVRKEQGELTDDLKDSLSKLEEAGKIIIAGRQKFEDIHKAQMDQIAYLDDQIAKLKAEKDEIEKGLTLEFKGFDKEEGVKKAEKEAASLLSNLMASGKNIDALVSSLDVKVQEILRASKSEQNAYKGLYETLVSMLNGSEYDVYISLFKDTMKKNIAEFSATAYKAKTDSKSFDDELVKKYEERKSIWDNAHPDKPLPVLKASRMLRVAGVKDILVGIGSWIKNKFEKLVEAFTKLAEKFSSDNKKLESGNKFLQKLIKEAGK